MSKTMKYISKIALAATLTVSCSTSTTTGGEPRLFPNVNPKNPVVIVIDQNDPAPVRKRQKENLGEAMTTILQSSYDFANYFLLKNEKDNQVGDLVIRAYAKDGYKSWPECGINIDNACDEFVRGTFLFEYLVGKDVYVFPSTGEVVKCGGINMDAAKDLDHLLSEYIKQNNGARCQYYYESMKTNDTPIGPRRNP